MSEEELKACAHCGKTGSILRHSPFQTRCLICGAEGPEAKTPEGADAWNRRTPAPMTSVVTWVRYTGEPETLPAKRKQVTTSFVKYGEVHACVRENDSADYPYWVKGDDIHEPFSIGDLWAYLPTPPEADA